jgi:hypothetical protein
MQRLNDPPSNPRAPLPKRGVPFGERNGRFVHGKVSREKRAERAAARDEASKTWAVQGSEVELGSARRGDPRRRRRTWLISGGVR